MARYLLLLCCFISSLLPLSAQMSLLRHGYSSSAAGMGLIAPRFNQGMHTQPWRLIHIRNHILDFQYAWGDFAWKQPGEADYHADQGTLMQIGFMVPIHKLTILQRKRYLAGLHLVPLAGLHYSQHSMGRIGGSGQGQSGLNLSTGLSLQFPLGSLELRLNQAFYFGNNPRLAPIKAYRGRGMFMPSMTLQLDGLFEQLGARVTQAGGYAYTRTYLVNRDRKYIGGGQIEQTNTYETRSYEGESNVQVMPAFYYVSIGASQGLRQILGPDQKPHAETYSGGAGQGITVGGRYRGFMIDLGADRNQRYYTTRESSQVEALAGTGLSLPQAGGTFQALHLRARAGVNLGMLVTNILMPRRNQNIRHRKGHWDKYVRLQGGLSLGLGLPGKTRLLNPESAQALDAFFDAHPEVQATSETDIRLNRAHPTFGMFYAWEMGPISVELEWHGHPAFGWRTAVGLRYLVPLNLIGKLGK